MMSREEFFSDVEQLRPAFYHYPLDADDTSSLRIMTDRWLTFWEKASLNGFYLMKLDQARAASDWITKGFTSDQGYLCWNVSFNDFFGIVKSGAFQVAMALTNRIHKEMKNLGFGPKDAMDEATREKLKGSQSFILLWANGYTFDEIHIPSTCYALKLDWIQPRVVAKTGDRLPAAFYITMRRILRPVEGMPLEFAPYYADGQSMGTGFSMTLTSYGRFYRALFLNAHLDREGYLDDISQIVESGNEPAVADDDPYDPWLAAEMYDYKTKTFHLDRREGPMEEPKTGEECVTRENVFQLYVADIVEKHKRACTRPEGNCKTCRLAVNQMESWDDTMRGKALEAEYGGMTADEIFAKLGWRKSPPRPVRNVTPSGSNNARTQELIEKYRKRKRLDI